MTLKTPWTVMVYLAADNDLTNFGIDSLKQMKAVCGDKANILAEFYSGPRRPTKRYLFDHKTALGSIEQNIICESPAKNPGDPASLTAFIQWAVKHYEAEHYFLIIWGHGSGCDEDFPRPANDSSVSDRSFVQRHRLLNPVKGVLDDASKGVLNDASKGVLDDASKGVLDEASKGVLDEASKSVLPTLTGQISMALKDIQLHFDPRKENRVSLQQDILQALEKGMVAAFADGISKDIHKRIIEDLKAGIENAAQRGVFNNLQRQLVGAFQDGGHDALETLLAVQTGPIARLLRKVVNVMQGGVCDTSQPGAPPTRTKGLAFSDHPASFLTNGELKAALHNACNSLPGCKRKIDIVGMDACHMNMVEIGYEIREYANYLVASQDAIPDASWPYDGILRQLLGSPKVLPRDLACVTATTYVVNYRDYVDQPVALSVLNLDESEEVLCLFKKFTDELERSKADRCVRQAIISARHQARSFGQNQFVDIVDFCRFLAEDPRSKGLGNDALALIGQLQPFIAYNETSCCNERGCNGTSIYFPEFDPTNFEHQHDLADIYRELDFAKQTGWGGFLADFLRQQTEEWKATVKIAQKSTGEAVVANKTKPEKKGPLFRGKLNGHAGSMRGTQKGEKTDHL
jgi:hypothetical protein